MPVIGSCFYASIKNADTKIYRLSINNPPTISHFISNPHQIFSNY